MYIDKLFELVDKGMEGKNKGLPMGLPKLEDVINGVQRSTYTLLAGGTGSGKTTLALYSYVYQPLMANLDNDKYKVVYYSLEMSGEILLAKLLSLHIFDSYGIELSYEDIISRKNVMSKDNYELVKSCMPWLQQVMQRLVIHDKRLTPNGLYASLKGYAERHGKFIDVNEHSTVYEPNNPDTIHMVIIDHLGLIRRDSGQSKKDAIDLASNYLIHFRNKCGFSALALTQLNRTSSSMDRRNGGMQELQLDDLKDSGGPSEDAELVIGIFNPFREKVQNYRGYNIAILRDKFRAIQVLKSRFGEADKSIGVSFFGSIGLWRELPKPDFMGRLMDSEYAPYIYLTTPQGETEEQAKDAAESTFVYRF